jgi:hypothetical protein
MNQDTEHLAQFKSSNLRKSAKPIPSQTKKNKDKERTPNFSNIGLLPAIRL